MSVEPKTKVIAFDSWNPSVAVVFDGSMKAVKEDWETNGEKGQAYEMGIAFYKEPDGTTKEVETVKKVETPKTKYGGLADLFEPGTTLFIEEVPDPEAKTVKKIKVKKPKPAVAAVAPKTEKIVVPKVVEETPKV